MLDRVQELGTVGNPGSRRANTPPRSLRTPVARTLSSWKLFASSGMKNARKSLIGAWFSP